MSELNKTPFITVKDYLDYEERSKSRHEYVRGQMFAMSGATEAHEVICNNLIALIHLHLRNSPCRVFGGNMKLRIEIANSFYYPDVMVTCEPYEAKSVFKASPTFLAEVLSPSTKQIDLREKLVAYKQLDSLKEYVIVHQNKIAIEIHRRCATTEWEVLKLTSADKFELQSLPGEPLVVPIEDVYAKVEFPLILEEDEEEYL